MSDTMLLGVLRMPFGLAMSTTTAQIQYHQRGVQAADEIEKMSAEIARLHKAHQAACEGGDFLRAELMQAIGLLEARLDTATRERDEARAEVERLKSEPETLRAELIAICNASRAALANAYDRARGSREALEAKP